MITKTYFDDIWSEIAFFYVGLRREISQDLLEEIYSYDSNEPTADFYKLLGGRLLQAGWHSPTQQYSYGIKKAIEYVPKVHKQFQEFIISSDSNIPSIFSDFLTLSLTDLSFNSAFLANHIMGVLKQLVDSESNDDIYKAIALFWSVRRFLKPDDVKENVDKILGKLISLPDDTEQARILLLMTLIEGDSNTRKRIGRRVKKLVEKSPKVFKALLPVKQKGFR